MKNYYQILPNAIKICLHGKIRFIKYTDDDLRQLEAKAGRSSGKTKGKQGKKGKKAAAVEEVDDSVEEAKADE